LFESNRAYQVFLKETSFQIFQKFEEPLAGFRSIKATFRVAFLLALGASFVL
jgi:hypothetical protein